MKWSLYFLSLVAAALFVAACDDQPDDNGDADLTDADQTDGDGDVDTEPPEPCPEFDEFERGDDGAEDLTLPPAEGRAVAGRITSEDQLLGGLKPKGRVGDILLANGRIALVIEDARPSDGYGVAGGEILDVDLVGPDGPLGLSLFNEMFLGLLAETVDPDEVTVMADGSDGGAAVVRATGNLAPVWLLEECCSFLFPRYLRSEVALDYILEPGAEAVAIRMTVRNDQTYTQQASSFLTVMIGGDGMTRYAPEVGFDEEADFGTQRFLGFVSERISHAWVVPESRSLYFMISQSGVQVFQSPGAALPACEDTLFELGHFVVAGGDATELEAAIRRLEGSPELNAVEGTVTEADGAPVAGARVHATGPDGAYLSMARTDGEGRYRLELEPGNVRVQAWADNRWPTEEVSVTLGEEDETADLSFGPVGFLGWVVRDGEEVEIPARVMVIPQDAEAPSAPAAFGESTHPYGAIVYDFTLPGRGEAPLRPGTYRVVASRGYEYELAEAVVELAEGETADLELTLERSVDTEGWLCGDFHVHTLYSPDSNDLPELKTSAAAAYGVELPVATDHRYVGELQPSVDELGLNRWLRWYPGQEITTVVYGHFNAYPLEGRADQPNNGAIDWVGLEAPELFATVRDYSTDPVLQVNHPRSGSAMGGYFIYAGLDPETLEVANPEGWSTNFDAIEVFNGSGWSSNRDETVLDWFGMLNHRYVVTATGNSDSHNAVWSDVGYPRNYLHLGTDVPDEVDGEMLRDTVRRGEFVVSGGLFITAETGGGTLPGGVAAADGGAVELHVRIQAPTWMDADHLEVFVDGVAVETVALDESTEDPDNPVVRLDRTFTLELAGDAWVVVAAWADSTLDPVTRNKQPFGVTNPIYIDADGDGAYADTDRTVE